MEPSTPAESSESAVVFEVAPTANVVRVFGDLDCSNVSLLEDALARAPQVRPLVIDLTGCNYLDSSVLSALIRAHKARTEAMRLVLPEDHRMRRVFVITNLDATLAVVPDLEAATRSIRAARPRRLRAV